MLQEVFNPSWYLIYGGLFLILAELFIGIEAGFDLVLIGTTLIIGGGVGNLTGDWQIGLIVTFILAVLYIVFGRRYVKNRLSVDHQPSNVDALIGKTGTVIKKIQPNNAGRIQVDNEQWRATANQQIKENSKVKIEKFSGVTAHVVKLE